MSKIILHIDLNQFFVRVEELKNPSLEGKPVIIGHVGRGGIVSTCSYAARKCGAASGMPTYKALQACPDAIVIPGNYSDYTTKSNEFINFVKRYTKIIEQVSIDECFADFTETLRNVENKKEFVKKMQMDLLKETGLKCSIGVAPTKFLAKMASDMKKPLGLTVISRQNVRKKLDPLPIEAFFGIGKKSAPKYRAQGINTIGDLAKIVNGDELEAERKFAKFYFTLKEWINGYGSDVVNTEQFDPQSVGHSTTMIHDTNDFDDIKHEVEWISKEISKQAKAKNKVGKRVQLVLKDNEFKTTNRSKVLSKPSNDENIIYSTALLLLEKNLNKDKLYRLVGVTLQDLVDPREVITQMSIFDNFDEIKEQDQTRFLIQELNRQFKGSVFKTAADILNERSGKKWN